MPDAGTRKTVPRKGTPVTASKMASQTAFKTASNTTFNHLYSAEAKALEGNLFMPVAGVIMPQAKISLPSAGGYPKSPPPAAYNLESVLSYTSAYTQVSGIKGVKECPCYATLSTSVVEGLNILEILTCDRIVAQVSTEHPLDGHTPGIAFLGTRFENLRIAGHPIDVRLNINMAGTRALTDKHYFHGSSLLHKVEKQCKALNEHAKLPQAARKRYTGSVTPTTQKNEVSLEFSLVEKITGKFPGKAFGHVIHVPHFGTIDLATVKITYNTNDAARPETTVELKMLEVNMGCIGNGNGDVAEAKTGGSTGP